MRVQLKPTFFKNNATSNVEPFLSGERARGETPNRPSHPSSVLALKCALVAARTVWIAVRGADLRETPADDVGGGDEPDDRPCPWSIEVVRDSCGDQRCDDDAEHRPELRRERSPLRFGAPTREPGSGHLHALAHRSFGGILCCHLDPFLVLRRNVYVPSGSACKRG